MREWRNARVILNSLPEAEWKVVSKLLSGNTLILEPRNELAQTIANLSLTGVVWTKTTDVTRLPEQKETLL